MSHLEPSTQNTSTSGPTSTSATTRSSSTGKRLATTEGRDVPSVSLQNPQLLAFGTGTASSSTTARPTDSAGFPEEPGHPSRSTTPFFIGTSVPSTGLSTALEQLHRDQKRHQWCMLLGFIIATTFVSIVVSACHGALICAGRGCLLATTQVKGSLGPKATDGRLFKPDRHGRRLVGDRVLREV